MYPGMMYWWKTHRHGGGCHAAHYAEGEQRHGPGCRTTAASAEAPQLGGRTGGFLLRRGGQHSDPILQGQGVDDVLRLKPSIAGEHSDSLAFTSAFRY
jgi:hypothetical protein